jgi:hypothetical protein
MVLRMAQDYAKAGQPEVAVIIDATPDVPWSAVIPLVERCRSENLQAVEFAAPLLRE